jgi:hypothetical protein
MSSYSSDTIEDLHTVLETLLRTNFNNSFNMIRLFFPIATLVLAMQTYGVQPQIVLFCFKSIAELLIHFFTFISGLVESMDTWHSYTDLSDHDSTLLLIQHLKHVKKSQVHRRLSPCIATEGTSAHHQKHNKSHKLLRRKHGGGSKSSSRRGSRSGVRVEFGTAAIEQHLEEDVEDCPICLSPQNLETVKLTCCAHRFHEGCVLCLLRLAGSDRAKKCPVCRAQITSDVFFPTDEDGEMGFIIPHM